MLNDECNVEIFKLPLNIIPNDVTHDIMIGLTKYLIED